MIITKSEPFTKEEIEKAGEQFEVYIKTVIDIEKRNCERTPQIRKLNRN